MFVVVIIAASTKVPLNVFPSRCYYQRALLCNRLGFATYVGRSERIIGRVPGDGKLRLCTSETTQDIVWSH